ncbi:fructosamine kinase family protein [Clavibacter michiganensis]|uniref:fructosamine kinase family protein n=1 Tax=Clavibacter michiganensis TaxID=28447 RepID=UPI00292DE15A|nr:fructosamine kinase family protein [Clavibacter michiganensis]
MAAAGSDGHGDAEAFRKERPDAPRGFFEAEAAGLAWLAEAEPGGGARVVRVIDVAPGRIDLERLVPARPTRQAARALGAALAVTHDAGAPAFGSRPAGLDGPAFIGRQPLSVGDAPAEEGDAGEGWGAWYARERVLPYLRLAVDAGNVASARAADVERACDLVADGRFDDDAPPARIHGDLWSGNVQWTDAGAVLIDPAAHGGHRETDLAMLALFGCPGLDDVMGAYADTGSLAAGWRARVPLHQLHPLAVHAASHGPAYGDALHDAARAVLRM